LSFDPSWVEEFGRETFEQALVGMAQVLRHTAPLYVMCDPVDLEVVAKIKAPHNEKPTLFLYDRYPGGIGLSEKLYDQLLMLLESIEGLLDGCACESGCPSCVGTNEGNGNQNVKQVVRTLLSRIKDVGLYVS
jgi:DEAD/DEAH box helicase domain-containing protein